MAWGNFLLTVAGVLFGVFVRWLYDRLRDHYKFKKELADNSHIDLTGDWFGAWQTSVDQQPLNNTEELILVQKGQTIEIKNKAKSPENPKAGYLWQGQLQFFQSRDILGWYSAIKEENLSAKGMLYMTYDAGKREFIGKWTGCSYDGPLLCGFVAIAKKRERAMELLQALLAKHPDRVAIISYSL